MTERSLHITNGDGAAGLIKAAGFAGDVLPWRDPMHHGPCPAGLDLDASSEVRALYLGGPADVAAFRARDAQLRNASAYDRVVLWFEHDLLDQVQLLQILDELADQDLPALEMICIDRFEGVAPFRGLGQLTPEQLGSLWPSREPVTADVFAVARAGWAAFRADDPRDLLSFLEGDLGALPFLRPALQRHLQEFPWAETGLSRTEHQMLSLVAEGVNDPSGLFRQNMDHETHLFIGDWRSFSTLAQLNKAGLLDCSPAPFWHPPTPDRREQFISQKFALTELGRAVLDGARDAFAVMDRDMWLGGVHLKSGQPMWVWDTDKLVLRQP
ncbi:uncharacterized protein DUF1835 [Litoreibacter ponti]|uniref:Uncharacterized protein DUF1835 n=1 Tax=Litoreibacter ponti TaxID=1510457 RepID=A0A2T6BM01_9RHOB|nr:DUF1835 domain-containing protein [Litoreibacter ponti]PTX57017.1 uncharacterized protein DUF1835 [Litoreibacter ponti]